MIYDIKAIPTTYAGVNFRSRLEARWAAFFDLADIKWEYEPFDLEGWCPDFLLKTEPSLILAEVKPIDLGDKKRHDASEGYEKAFKFWRDYQILLLGFEPAPYGIIGSLLDEPDMADHTWCDIYDAIKVDDPRSLWREAGNIVQWQARQAA